MSSKEKNLNSKEKNLSSKESNSSSNKSNLSSNQSDSSLSKSNSNLKDKNLSSSKSNLSSKESNSSSKDNSDTLEGIRLLIESADCLRFNSKITRDERLEIEKLVLDLRQKERLILSESNKEISRIVKISSLPLEELSKRIRDKSAKLSVLAKETERINQIIKNLIKRV